MGMPEAIDAGPVELRRWRPSMAAELADAVRSSLAELRPWMPWADGEPSAARQRRVLAEGEALFDRDHAFEYALFEPGDTTIVGCAGLRHPEPERAEVGYWVRTDRHRRGYARAAAGALATGAFDHLGVEVVELHVHVANAASAAVARSLGFVPAGVHAATPSQRPGDVAVWRVARGWQPGRPGDAG